MPMDIEWARDGITGEMFIVQARPETVRAREHGADFTTFALDGTGEVLLNGVDSGSSIMATAGDTFLPASVPAP